MKPSLFLLLPVFILMGYKGDTPAQQKGLIPEKRMLHVGIVVKDINKSLDKWVLLLGLEKRPDISVAEGHEANPTKYMGKLSPAKAKLAFMKLENIQLELIEPIGNEASDWKDFLSRTGGGVHHVAFEVKGMEEQYVDKFNKAGLPMVQHGGWDGGEYGYMDGMKSLGVMVELIEQH